MLKVVLLSHTPNPEHTVAAAARNCYSDSGASALYDSLTSGDTAALINRLCKLGHLSPFEHVSFTFGIDGVSRTLLAQLTRHRIASYSVKSQRYVSERDFSYVIPPKIAQSNEALDIFLGIMDRISKNYEELSKIVPKEDARYILPGACETSIVTTMNARALLNFFSLRLCMRAQWEIRALAQNMLKLVLQAAPSLFAKAGPGCVTGSCPEGDMTCGMAEEVRERFRALRAGV